MISIDDEQCLVKFKIKTIVYLPLFYIVVVFLENPTYVKIDFVFISKKKAQKREGFSPIRISRGTFESHANPQNSLLSRTVPYVDSYLNPFSRPLDPSHYMLVVSPNH